MSLVGGTNDYNITLGGCYENNLMGSSEGLYNLYGEGSFRSKSGMGLIGNKS